MIDQNTDTAKREHYPVVEHDGLQVKGSAVTMTTARLRDALGHSGTVAAVRVSTRSITSDDLTGVQIDHGFRIEVLGRPALDLTLEEATALREALGTYSNLHRPTGSR